MNIDAKKNQKQTEMRKLDERKNSYSMMSVGSKKILSRAGEFDMYNL